MKITNSNLNFNAKYLDRVEIRKKRFLGYKPCEVSLIEFDRNNPNDLQAMNHVVHNYGPNSPVYTMLWSEPVSNQHIVGITTQKDNFENPVADNILALMQYYDYKDLVYISKLQVEPKYKYEEMKFFRKYKDIGKAFIKKVKMINDNKRLEVCSLEKAIPFYEKIGFRHNNNMPEKMFSVMYLE